MYAQREKLKDNKSRVVVNSDTQKKSNAKQGFRFVDNRPETIAQRKLQEMANDSRYAKQATRLGVRADNYFTRQGGCVEGAECDGLGNVIQRVVTVNGNRVNLGYLRRRGWAEYLVSMVSVWDSSNLTHAFPDRGALWNWLQVAKRRLIGEVPDLYTRRYFRFTTEAGGRAPSLYFIKSQSEHGRIRQQHAQGPIIDELGGTKEDFFYNESEEIEGLLNGKYDVAADRFRAMGAEESAEFRQSLRMLGATNEPASGQSHLEIMPAEGAIQWIHESGGTVGLPSEHLEYNDEMIRSIYLETAGRVE